MLYLSKTNGIYMILTVTLNASMDKKYVIDKIEYDEVNRIKEVENSAGGKGLNVSRVLKITGSNVIATGFVGGHIGDYIIDSLNKYEIKNDFVKVKDESRCCINLINLSDMSQTEYLEPGFILDEDDINRFIEKYNSLLDLSDIVILSGSAPKGAPKDIYKTLVEIANNKNKKTILDVSGEYLKYGILAKPYAIKPNKKELEDLVQKKINNFDDLKEIANTIILKGIDVCLVSCGAEGIYAFTKEETYFKKAPKINLKNATGSGDSSVAGFASGLEQNLSIDESLKLAVAYGSANAMEDKTGFVSPEVIEELLKKIE